MAKVIDFPKKSQLDRTVKRLKQVSDDIDSIIIAALEEGVEPRDLSGVLAHRLGSLMRNIDEKSKLWGVCEKVLKKQAEI